MNAIVMPAESFEVLAAELRLYANREVGSNHLVEVFLSGLPAGLTPGHRRMLTDLKASAALVGQASMLLSLLAPHEAAVRALVEASITPRPEPAGERHVCLSGT